MDKTRGQKGFTLIEMVLVLGLLALLVAIVVPNTVGYLRRGEERSYNADKKLLQASVDAFYTDESNRVAGVRKYPTDSGIGSNTSTYAWISMPKLVNANMIPSAPPSASSPANAASGGGNYEWWVDARGRVQSTPTYTAGTYP